MSHFVELWGGAADSLPHPIQRSLVCFESLYFFQNIKSLVSLDLTANPGGLCVYFTGLCPCKQTPLVFQLVRPRTWFVFSPFIFVSITATCCREEMKRSLEVYFYESVNLFLNLLNYLLCLPFFNDRWIRLWLVLFPKVTLGMKGINYMQSKCSWC